MKFLQAPIQDLFSRFGALFFLVVVVKRCASTSLTTQFFIRVNVVEIKYTCILLLVGGFLVICRE